MTDLDTSYLGLDLRSPIVASAGPLTGDPDTAARLEDAGRRRHRAALAVRGGDPPRGGRAQPRPGSRRRALRRGARLLPDRSRVRDRRRPLPRTIWRSSRPRSTCRSSPASTPPRPAAGSATPGCWPTPAPTPSSSTSTASPPTPTATAADVEAADLELVAAVVAARRRPAGGQARPLLLGAWPTSPAGSSPPAPTGWCCSTASTSPTSTSRRSTSCPASSCRQPWELRLPLRWIAILRPLLDGRGSLAATTGVHSGTDVAKALLVGADVAMTTSARAAPRPRAHRAPSRTELRAWMADHEYESVAQLRGSVSHATTDDPAAFERANYLRILHSWT